MWRRTLTIFAILIGVLVGTAVALKSRRVAENLESYFVRVAHDRYGVTLHIDQLELELVPPGVAVRGVEVYRPGRAEPWASLHRGRVVFRPWPSVAGAVVVHHLSVDGLRADLDLSGIGARVGDETDTNPTRPAFDIRELMVWNASVNLRTDNGSVFVERADFRMTPASIGARDVTVRLPRAVLKRGDDSYELEASATGRFRGTLDRPEDITIQRSVVFTRGVAVDAQGTIDLDSGDPALDLALATRAPLARIRELVPQMPELAGELTATLALHGPAGSPRSRIRARVEDLRGFGKRLGNVDVTAVHEGGHVNVESFRLHHPVAGMVTGSGTVELVPDAPVNLAARLHDASLPHILDLVGLPNAWVRLGFNGDLRATGHLIPLRLNLGVAGTVAQFDALDRSYRDGEAVPVLTLGPTYLSGTATLTTHGISLGGLSVRRGDSELTVGGSLSFDTEVGLDLRAVGESFELGEVGPVAGIPFEGRGALAAAIEGPYEAPTISGTMEVGELAVLGYDIGNTKATLIYSGSKLTIDRCSVRRGDGNVTGTGSFLFGGDKPLVRAALALDRISAEQLLLSAGLPREVASRFAAQVSGGARLNGPVDWPTGRFSLRAPLLQIDSVPVGAAKLRGGFGTRSERAWAEIDLKPKHGALKGLLAVKKDESLNVAVDAESLPLTVVAPFIGNVPITGQVSGTADLTGPANELSGSIEASAENLTAWGLRLERADLHGDLREGRMQVKGTLLSGDARVGATLGLGRTLPFTATAAIAATPVDRIYPLGGGVDVTVAGSLTSEGDLTDPDSLSADMRLSTGDVSWKGFTLGAVRPVAIQYANGAFRINDLSLAGAGTTVGVSGTVATTGALDLRVVGQGDLRSMTSADSELTWIAGGFEVNSAVSGTIAVPELYGQARVHDGALRVGEAAQLIEKIQVGVELAGQGIRVRAGSAQTGGGTLRFAGELARLRDEQPRLDLRASLDSVNLRPLEDLHTRLSGDLNLSGPIGDLILRGNLDLEALRYAVNLDLKRLIPRRHAPLRVPTLEGGNAIALAVAVKGDNNLILSNNVVEAEFRADLMVTGTSERLGLIGSITPLWAKARYRDNEFTLERGSIDMTEEYIIFTRFDLRATTEACGMRIAVDIQGNSDSTNVIPSGQDENGSVDPQDVLACIQFGMRVAALQDKSGTNRGTELRADPWAALSSSPYATGLDALWMVSGMDEKVNRLLPIRLDEVRLESGWSSEFKRNTMRVLVGKELSEGLRLKYSSSLDELADQTVSVEYRLSDRARLEGTWLSASDVPIGDLGVDLKLRLEFR